MPLYACGSNGSGQLALGSVLDTSSFLPCQFDPSVPSPSTLEILDIASAAHHSLLLARLPSRAIAESTPGLVPALGPRRNYLFGVGTNSYGQLGQRCALKAGDQPQGWTRWRVLDLLPRDMRADGRGEWEPVRVATTWTTSFVVFRRMNAEGAGGATSGRGPGGDNQQGLGSRGGEEVLVACGSNDFGELGVGQEVDEFGERMAGPVRVELGLEMGETVQMLRTGQRHVLALIRRADGTQRVVGWGASRKGELDPRSYADQNQRQHMDQTQAQSRGKGKGKAATPRRSTLPHVLSLIDHPHPPTADERIIDLALGAAHSALLLSSGRVLAWGSNAKGQTDALHEVRGVRAVGATWNGTYLLCAPTASGEGQVKGDKVVLLSQGSNTHSQLLRPTQTQAGDAGDYGAASSAALSTATCVSGSGSSCGTRQIVSVPFPLHESAHPSPPPPPAPSPSQGADPQTQRQTQLVCGTEHILLRLADGSVLAGGWNEHGNLGQGDEVDRAELVRVDMDDLIRGERGGAGVEDRTDSEQAGGARTRATVRARAKRVWAGCAASWIWT